MPDIALSDVRVLDLSDNIAGAYCAQLLASCGAEVIKIEPPLLGDLTRASGPFPGDLPDQEKSGLFMHLNGNKKGITLNIATESGQAVLKKLVAKTDVLIETFAPAYLPSLGLDFQDLEHVNPALVMTSITSFGQTGPYKDFKATDIGVFAMSGRMYVHGLPGMAPLPYAPDVIWYQVGATAAAATMGGIFNAKFQGVGQQVDVSALESLIGNVDSRCLFLRIYGRENHTRAVARRHTPRRLSLPRRLRGYRRGLRRLFSTPMRRHGPPRYLPRPQVGYYRSPD